MRELVSDGANFCKVRMPIKFLNQVKELICAKAVEQTHLKELSLRVYTSLGIFMQVRPFLTPKETLELQCANKFYYEHAVGRIQTTIRHQGGPVDKSFFVWMYSQKFTDKVAIVDKNHRCTWLKSDLFNFEEEYVVQVRDSLFTHPKHHEKLAGSWVCYSGILSKDKRIQVEVKADPKVLRFIADFVNFRDQFVFAIGGDHSKTSVERYNVANDTWSTAPRLNRSTNQAAVSCVLGAFIYSSGGWYNGGFEGQDALTIERLNAKL